MKHLLLIATFVFTTVVGLGQNPTINLKINGLTGGKPIALNSTVASSDNTYYFTVSMMRYYITGISIIHDGGTVTNVPDGVILVNEAAPQTVALGQFAVSNIEAIKFFIGVDQTRNHLDPASYPAFHALAPKDPTMHWGWSAGYRFVTVEGRAGSSAMMVNTPFEIHSLSDALYASVTVPFQHSVKGAEATIELNAEYNNLLNGIDVTQGPISHAGTGISKTLYTNFITSVFSPAKTASVHEENQVIAQVFPNPSADHFVVSAPEFTGWLRLVNSAGEVVLAQQIANRANVPTQALSNGKYYVVLQNASGLVGRYSVVVQK